MCRALFRAISLAALISLCSFSAAAQRAEDPDGDTQFWPDIQVSFRLHPKVALNLFGTSREGRDISVPVNEQVGGAVSFSLNKYLTVGPGYRFIATQPTPTRHSHENRFFFDVTMRLPLRAGFAVSDRNRGEARNIDGTFSQRYRNRLQVERAFSIHDHRFTPYVSSEAYYDRRFHDWVRWQHFIGVRVPVHQHVTLDSYYLKQNDARSRPGYLQVLGMSVRLDF